jgi:hypothetical protein
MSSAVWVGPSPRERERPGLRPAVDHIFVNAGLSPTHLNVHRTVISSNACRDDKDLLLRAVSIERCRFSIERT